MSETDEAAAMAAEAQDATVLWPSVTLTIRGETVTVRELSYREELQWGGRLRPMVAQIDALMQSGGDVNEALQDHFEHWAAICTLLCDRDAAWFDGLSRAEGQEVGATVLRVNAAFFLAPMFRRMVTAPPPGDE